MSVPRARLWLDQVARDLNAARSCARGEVPEAGHAAFCVQQAAEKLVMAALIVLDLPAPRSHDIDALARRLPPDFPDRERYIALGRFTPYATTFRYPGDDGELSEPSLEDIEAWIDEIGGLRATLVMRLQTEV